MKQLTLELRDESYHSIDDLGVKQKQVYDLIRYHGEMTNKQIAKWLDWEINCVTGRVRELCDMGLVYAAGKVYDASTNRNVTVFKIV